jgi:hypothetical protein
MVGKPLHTEEVTVWCGVSAFGIIGPYFFEENNRTVAVTAARCQVMLALLELPDDEDGELWFQQDGATAHTALASMA